MHFFWLTKENPLGANTGARIYSNGLLVSLLETGTTGTLVAYSVNGEAPKTPDGLSLRLAQMPHRLRALSLFSQLQSDAYRLKSQQLTALIRQTLNEKPDVVIVDYFAMCWALPVIKSTIHEQTKHPPIVYVTHNYEPAVRRQVAESVENLAVRQVLKWDARKATRLDLSMIGAADLIVTNTDEDKVAYQRHVPTTPIITLKPAYDGKIQPTRPINQGLPRRAVIAGAFDWIAKQLTLRRFLDAAKEIFPQANIDLLVVGRAPSSFLEEMRIKYSFCRFTGQVDDIRPYLNDARIGIMPDDIGGGFKHKYLYYIFAGLPIATIKSQFAGLPLDIDRDVFACSTIEELAQVVVAHIDDVALLDSMRQRCWDACAQEFNWTDRGEKLRTEIDMLIGNRVAK